MGTDDSGRSGRSGEFRDLDGRTLPQRIRGRRTARRMKSLELAAALNVSPSYVTMIERGKKIPSEDIAVAIAELLDDDPELYRAWVHSTRFTDPTSTLRGLQRLHYSGPRNQIAPVARFASASQRARRRWDASGPGPGADSADADESIAFLRSRSIPPGVDDREERFSIHPSQVPLIALGEIAAGRVRFWRLPWALLDNDPRTRRFLVAATATPDELLVATPRQFADVVMKERGTNYMDSHDWLGWQTVGAAGNTGGVHAQPLDPGGRLGALYRDRQEFLDSLGPFLDVVVRDGASVSIRRLSISELAARLNPVPG